MTVDLVEKMNGGDDVAAAPAGPPVPLEWKFSQVFGERTAGEEVQEGNLFVQRCIWFEKDMFFMLSLLDWIQFLW